ncbi:MAG: alkaline phosphatase family protein [Bacteroidales bacterium]|nr:alkaline phosphatase family protein [Bacteroidales bacterium]
MKRIWLLALLALVVSCKSNEKKRESVPESKGAYEHVVILGVDGAGAFFAQADTPQTDEIFKNAARTYRAKTSFPTISAQCWGSMLLGVLPDVHKLTNEFISNNPYDTESPYPSIFRVVRERWPDAPLASFCNWNPINNGIIENNLGVVEGTGDDPEVARLVIDYLGKESPTLLFVQFDSVDGAGHSNGYGTEGHLAALSAVDDLIGQIHRKLEAKGILNKTLFIVTADHGGTPEGSHGGDTEAERYVFLGVSGKTVCNDSLIKDAEVRDIPSIVAYALGLDCPETWTGRVPEGLFPGVPAL